MPAKSPEALAKRRRYQQHYWDDPFNRARRNAKVRAVHHERKVAKYLGISREEARAIIAQDTRP